MDPAITPITGESGRKTTRHWDAWTREEEENFFIALRHVGKNFEKITRRVQSKNKDQVRHYYYRLIKRMNKVLGPGFLLDAKNSKDANSAMLRWWSLLEKHSCSASKLHLKPRRFKTFVTALEHQLLKDRMKANKKQAARAVSVVTGPVIVAPVSGKPDACSSEAAQNIPLGDLCLEKAGPGRSITVKRKTEPRAGRSKSELSRPPRQRKKPSDNVSAAALKKWEKAASAGVNLVAEAAEQLERAAAAEQQGQSEMHLKPCTPPAGGACSEMQASLPTSNTEVGSDHNGITEGNHVEAVVEGEKQADKLKLQLFPIDEATRKSLEQDGLNPYLELTLKPRKAISSVLRHLTQKWGRSSAAVGQLQLFPFGTQRNKITTTSSQSWSICDAHATAGDVYAASGNPSVFRLRYGWLSSRVLQSSSAELSELPGSSPSSAVGVGAGLQVNSQCKTGIHATAHVPLLSRLSSGTSAGTETKIEAGGCETVSQGVCACIESTKQQDSSTQTACTQCNPISQMSIMEPVRSQNLGGTGDALIHPRKISEIHDDKEDTDPKKLVISKGSSLVSTECSNGLVQVDALNALSVLGDSSAGFPSDRGRVFSNKLVHNGGHLGRCSWFYEGSNDSFPQRLWSVQEPGNGGSLLPTEIDWVDSLTNISVGELLNEVSQAGHIASGPVSTQALQPIQSLDSFDAAVAAQSMYALRVGTNVMHCPETSAWDGEDTRDGFAFQKVVSQRNKSVSTNCDIETSRCEETMKESDAIAVTLSDCGSLEAWKQSFSHVELQYPDEAKGDPASQFSQPPPELVSKQCSAQELYWDVQADSLGSLDLGISTSANVPSQEPFIPKDMSLSCMVGSSLDVMQACSSPANSDYFHSSTSCERHSSAPPSMVPASSVCITMTSDCEDLQKEATATPDRMPTC